MEGPLLLLALAAFPVSSALLPAWRSAFRASPRTLWPSSSPPLGPETPAAALAGLPPADRALRGVVIGPPYRDPLKFDANATLLDAAARTVEITSGFSKDVWDYVTAYTGLAVSSVVSARTWGSAADLNDTMSGILAAGGADVGMGIMAHCCGRFGT